MKITRPGSVISIGMSDEKDKAWYDINENIKDIKSIKRFDFEFIKRYQTCTTVVLRFNFEWN